MTVSSGLPRPSYDGHEQGNAARTHADVDVDVVAGWSNGDAAFRKIIEDGSKSFAAASLLLPKRIRSAAARVYAFCRVADDAVDLSTDVDAAVRTLHARLDVIYGGGALSDPVERGFSEVARVFALPRELPLALLEGFRWDAEGRSYETIDELLGYCARVASSVGVMMTLLMGPRDRYVLARACDLGIAMQLTNICRDVGEDARSGRVYLPRDWLRGAGVAPEALGKRPYFTPELARVVQRTLAVAEGYYARANVGIGWLPPDCRIAIRAASLIYSDIGRIIAANGYDSVFPRASTTRARKALLLARAVDARVWPRRSNVLEPADATRFLIEAVRGRVS